MTSRRLLPVWDGKVSRAFQFRPGHVGGRVASAQPVVRNNGTVRGWPIGEMDAEDEPEGDDE